MQLWRCLLLGILLGYAPLLLADDDYVVRYVYDGDTVKLQSLRSGTQFKLRLAHIDAPERNQPYGLKSRRALLKLCQGEAIKVDAAFTGYDKYGRRIGSLYCNRIDAGLYLIEQGLAWYPSQYSHHPQASKVAVKAKSKQTGLWQDAHPIPPWVWRKQHAAASMH
jgi:micrococcal nuclease